jgi:hypothetical protein
MSKILDEVLTANRNYAETLATKQLSLYLPLDALRFSHAWTPGLIRQNTPA